MSKQGPWRTVANNMASLFGRNCVSERRLAALEDRLAKLDGGPKADQAISDAVGKHNAEFRGSADEYKNIRLSPDRIRRG